MRFLAPGFLLLLPLAFLPVIIHLLSRFRLRRLPFPSLLLLQTVRRQRFSWLRLREIVLLVLRTLALLFLLFALSRPYLPRLLPGLKTEDLLVILDDSYSMGYGSRWTHARLAAQRFINAAARPQLILTSQPDTIFTGKKLLGNLLDTLQPTPTAPTLTRALNRAFAESRTGTPPLVLITDLQRVALPETGLGKPPAPLHIVHLGRSEFVNAGIQRLYLDNKFIRAQITNYSTRPITRTVRLRRNNNVEEQTINIAPRTTTTVSFTTPHAGPGLDTGCVTITADSLPLDDSRYFAFTVPAQVPLLIVRTAAAWDRYLNLVLAADRTGQFLPTTVDLAELRRLDLRRYPLLIITDAAALQSGDWDRVEFYLGAGGAALIIAGTPLPDLSGLNRLLKSRGFNRPTGFLTVARIDTTHPILNIFQPQDFSSARFFAVNRLSGGRDLMQLSSGDPLIIELPEKRLIVWTFVPAPSATDFVFKAPFAPLFIRTLNYLTTATLRTEYTIGDTIVLPVKSTAPVTLSTPEGIVSLSPLPGQPRPRVVFSALRTPGIYRVDSVAVAVNPDAREGDLAPLPDNLLPRTGITVQNQALPAADLTAPLLFLALLAFVFEMVILVFELFFQKRSPVRK
jgi:hypothetical protein